MKANSLLWSLAGLLFLIVAVVAVYKAKPLLFPDIQVSASLNPDCDLRAGPCASRLPEGGVISFAVEPRSIPVIKPLALRVAVTGLEARAVEVDFVGVDMNMGFNRTALEMHEPGLYRGEGMLPVCVRDAMEWEARVLVYTDAGLVSAPYRFITVKPGVELPGIEDPGQ